VSLSSEKAPQQTTTQPLFELLNAEQLAKRLNLPVSWIREMTRSRASDPIPHLQFGRYIRFQWGAPELANWIGRRMRGGKQ
jgi:hypothetical protein